MKLLVCRSCGDVVRIYAEPRRCHCERSEAHYMNDELVLLSGPCVAVGLDTKDVALALAAGGGGGGWAVSSNVVRRPPG